KEPIAPPPQNHSCREQQDCSQREYPPKQSPGRRSWAFCRVRSTLVRLRSLYWCDEAISSLRDSLDEAGIVGTVAESLSQPVDGTVQTAVEVHIGVCRPKPLPE